MQLNYIVLGQRIQKIRKSKHISQAVLSAMIDKSAGYISYLECGTKVMSLETFVSIANALEVSTDTAPEQATHQCDGDVQHRSTKDLRKLLSV